MATPDNESPPELTEATPDWTYEELIDTFVKDYSVSWLERYHKHVSRGFISKFTFEIIVELRNPPSKPAPIDIDSWSFFELQKYRFWFLDGEGLEEIDRAKYQEEMADTDWINSSAYSSRKFCFENDYRYMIVHFSAKRNNAWSSRDKIGRNSDGKLYIEESTMLGMS